MILFDLRCSGMKDISSIYADDVKLIQSLSRNQGSSISLKNCFSIFEREGQSVNPSKCKQLNWCLFVARHLCCFIYSDNVTKRGSLQSCTRLIAELYCFVWSGPRALYSARMRFHIVGATTSMHDSRVGKNTSMALATGSPIDPVSRDSVSLGPSVLRECVSLV